MEFAVEKIPNKDMWVVRVYDSTGICGKIIIHNVGDKDTFIAALIEAGLQEQ